MKLTWKKKLVKRRIVSEKESKRVKEKSNLEGRKVEDGIENTTEEEG